MPLASAENAHLVRMFDVRVTAMDYPVGFDECFRVNLHSTTLNANVSTNGNNKHKQTKTNWKLYQIKEIQGL